MFGVARAVQQAKDAIVDSGRRWTLGALTQGSWGTPNAAQAVQSLRLLSVAGLAAVGTVNSDPCAIIGGQTWVAPADVRACYTSFALNETEKTNILDVVTKTLNFHTSVNYAIEAPVPFTTDIHEDLVSDFARIRNATQRGDYDLHVEISRTLKRLNDGHCVYINFCYDSAFVNYLPTPLTLLTDSNGTQTVHIAPEAFVVTSKEFPEQIEFWQDSLPGALKGQLASLSGAKVLTINGEDPWLAVDRNAGIAGSYQAFGTRQNGFFSSYQATYNGWSYIMGQFAQQPLPLDDSVTLTIQRVNDTAPVNVTIPYRSRIGITAENFTDSATFRVNNCRAVQGVNGRDHYAKHTSLTPAEDSADSYSVTALFEQAAPVPKVQGRRELMNVMLDTQPPSNVPLPPVLEPALPPLNGSIGVAQFFLLPDNTTGVLALGSFSGAYFSDLQRGLLDGLLGLRARNATRLVVDVTNNGGGYICAAHWLHRIIVGPRATTEPQAGLDTKARAGPLAQLIVKQIVHGGLDPNGTLLYHPTAWRFANGTDHPADYDWLDPPVTTSINGRKDSFSHRLGQECQPFSLDPPPEALFAPKDVVIISNGRCASSCSLFSITMSKLEGVKTVVVGGNASVPQQYCGIVGGQSTGFSTVDSEIKTAHLKDHPLAPPDFLTKSIQGITWRLGFGIWNASEPEEWQSHPADVNLPLTAEIVNKPAAIWKAVVEAVFT